MSAVKNESILDRIAIAEMTTADLSDVVRIERESGLSPWGRVGYLDELFNLEAIMLIARYNRRPYTIEPNVIVGFATGRLISSSAEMHINNIAVGTDFRRMGIGGRMLRALLAQGRALGADSALLEVRASNLAAQALYQGFGFSVIGERRNYYAEPAENALVMRGILPGNA